MIKLVNFTISEDKKVKIKKYSEDGDHIIIYEQNKVAIIDTDKVDINGELSIIQFEDIPFPVLLSKSDGERIIEVSKERESVLKETETETETEKEPDINRPEIFIQNGEKIKD